MSIGSFPIFQDFGAVVMSDLILETRPCLQLRRGRGRSMNVKTPMVPIPFFAASTEMETDAGAFSDKISYLHTQIDRQIDRSSPLFSYIYRRITSIGMAFKMAKTLPMAYPLLNVGPEQGYMDQASDQPPLRSYFPETWLWELVPTGYMF